MGNVDVKSEVSDPWARASVRVTCPVNCTGRIGIRLEFGSDCNVRMNVKLKVSITMRLGNDSADVEVSLPGDGARVRVRFSEMCNGRMGLGWS